MNEKKCSLGPTYAKQVKANERNLERTHKTNQPIPEGSQFVCIPPMGSMRNAHVACMPDMQHCHGCDTNTDARLECYGVALPPRVQMNEGEVVRVMLNAQKESMPHTQEAQIRPIITRAARALLANGMVGDETTALRHDLERAVNTNTEYLERITELEAALAQPTSLGDVERRSKDSPPFGPFIRASGMIHHDERFGIEDLRLLDEMLSQKVTDAEISVARQLVAKGIKSLSADTKPTEGESHE